MAGIHIKPSQRGSLHRLLGVPQKSKIPAADLMDEPGDSMMMKRKKNFARNAKKFNHSGSSLNKLMGQ